MGALCILTLKTRLGSCMRALAYWSSVTQSSTRKLSLIVLTDDSVFVSWKANYILIIMDNDGTTFNIIFYYILTYDSYS